MNAGIQGVLIPFADTRTRLSIINEYDGCDIPCATGDIAVSIGNSTLAHPRKEEEAVWESKAYRRVTGSILE
jgi:hypothetical protein